MPEQAIEITQERSNQSQLVYILLIFVINIKLYRSEIERDTYSLLRGDVYRLSSAGIFQAHDLHPE
ncbi:protein of unknown function [Methylocaldum szegediense]|uniref:Uncharacterized protein n=1 Tax=Methylocaldum szegediense TaxID=73780 RepID=A0ABM9I296_9GAMM|nr:protein of unknown function [Methylocaldum szegediense]